MFEAWVIKLIVLKSTHSLAPSFFPTEMIMDSMKSYQVTLSINIQADLKQLMLAHTP